MTQDQFNFMTGVPLLVVIVVLLANLLMVLGDIKKQLKRIANANESQASSQERLVEIELPVLSSALGDISRSLDEAIAPINIENLN